MDICPVCNEEIKDNESLTTCDSCGLEMHSKHLGDFNECPSCGEEHTSRENF